MKLMNSSKLGEMKASCSNLTNHLTDKIERVDEQIKLLQQVRFNLTQSLARCQSDDCEFEKMNRLVSVENVDFYFLKTVV